MTRITKPFVVLLLTITCAGYADIFTNRSTGETFNGYALQNVINGKGRVYVETDGNFDARTIILSDYDIKYDAKGRRDNVIIIPFKEKEAQMSKVVSETFAKTIIEAANKGPLCVIIELDSPGGRGDYMNIICKAILSANNCPVIAYITGEKFGGVYGSAAAIALACDKIYISPSASIGSLAPAFASPSDESYSDVSSPVNLTTYSGYAAKLAAKNKRPQILAAAMMDRSIEVLEVVVDQNGTREFINALDKTPSQNLIKRWTRSINAPSSLDSDTVSKQNVLTITGQDAIYCQMADKIAISQADVLFDLKVSDAKVIKSPVIASVSKKFTSAQNNVAKLIASIEYREEAKEKLEDQLSKIRTQDGNINIRLQTNEQIRNGNRNAMYYDRNGNSNRYQRNRNDMNTTQTTQTDERSYARTQITIELAEVIQGLIDDYQQLIKYAKKYPGAIPAEASINKIDNKLTTARIRLNNLYNYAY